MARDERRGHHFKALNDFIFASDLFRKVKEVEEEELKENH